MCVCVAFIWPTWPSRDPHLCRLSSILCKLTMGREKGNENRTEVLNWLLSARKIRTLRVGVEPCVRGRWVGGSEVKVYRDGWGKDTRRDWRENARNN